MWYRDMATPKDLPSCISELRRTQAKVAELVQIQYKQMPAWVIGDVMKNATDVVKLAERMLTFIPENTNEWQKLKDKLDELKRSLGIAP